MTEPRVVILEGPDGGGKSTLAEALATRLGAGIDHHGPYPDDRQPWHRYAQSLIQASEDPARTPVVLDRSWLSEFPYGRVFRGHVRFDEPAARGLERLALSLRAVVVNCVPEEETVLEAYRARKETEYLDSTEQLTSVRDWFRDRLHQATALPVIWYNRDVLQAHGRSVEDAAEGVLRQAREQYDGELLTALQGEPADHGMLGNPYGGDVLLIGDRSNAVRRDLPFFGLTGCSPWLSYRLDESGVPESRLAWFNARRPGGSFKDAAPVWAYLDACARQGREPTILTLGAVASAWAESEDLPGTWPVKHPQAQKRFSYHDEYELVRILREV